MDYEHSNFSISPAVFPDGLAKTIVPIKPKYNASASTTRASALTHQRLVIGASTAAGVPVLIALFCALYVKYRWRRRLAFKRGEMQICRSDTSSAALPSPFHIKPTASLLEIASRSTAELPNDAVNIEILDESSPSGSAQIIQELYSPDIAALRGFSGGSSQSPNETMRNKLEAHHQGSAIHTPLKRTRQCKSNKSALNDTKKAHRHGVIHDPPRVWSEIAVNINPSEESQDLKASASKAFPRAVALDLDRPLPPTPISESPQISASYASHTPVISARGSMHYLIELIDQYLPHKG